jgi:hypothetical protein
MNELHDISINDNSKDFEGLLVANYRVQCIGLGFSGWIYKLQCRALRFSGCDLQIIM